MTSLNMFETSACRMIACWCLATSVVVVTSIDTSGNGRTGTSPSPPMLIQQAAAEKAYKVGDIVTLPCEARGFPPPTYEWLKNGDKFETSAANGVRQIVDSGSIQFTIDELRSQHDGVYQCSARNTFGTAVSIKTQLRQAALDPFPSVKEPRVHRPAIGSPLTLRCAPPASYPVGSVYWGETKNGPKLRPIENTNRISLDYEGNLHFANIEQNDDLGSRHAYLCVLSNDELRSLVQGDDQRIIPYQLTGGLHFSNVEEGDSRSSAHYVCVVYNAELRNIVEGDDQRIEPQRITETPKYEAPRVMWSSSTVDVAIKGQTKRMKCIFSGYPTPTVRWIRLGGVAMPDKNLHASFGQELIIPDADFSDTGRYQCSAVNSATVPPAVREFNINVESTPYWRNEQRPENVDTSEDEDAVFECSVNGFPKPTITWSVNGRPLDASPNPRRSLESGGNRLVFRGVIKSDAQVIQCNASNTHGYIFANAYLNVLAEPPSFIEEPKRFMKASLGRSATLTCRVFGAPKPTIVWQKGINLEDVEGYYDRRYTKLSNGDLEIQSVNLNDNDTYQCYACNKFGCDARSGQLLVIEPTVIVNQLGLSRQQVTAGSNVTLFCNATTDPSELERLRVTWRRGDVTIPTGSRRDNTDDEDEGLLVVSDDGRRLTIVGARVANTGRYTCHAENGIDSDSATVHLTVRDRPEPPTDVRLNSCEPAYADVAWIPGADNNERITGYIVYYSTSHDTELVSTGASSASSLHEAVRVDAGKQSVRVRNLAPWNEYSFYVAASNDVGLSDPAKVTTSLDDSAVETLLVCSTPDAKPARSPKRVCTDSRKPDHLVIVWEPMLRSEHYGPGFQYVVTYQRLDLSDAEIQTRIVSDWRQSELEIPNQPAYTEYRVSVQAKNNRGSATPSVVVGHSGEDVPLESPTNFQLVENSLNATSASFSWDSVDRSLAKIRGFFKGYQIRFWRTGDSSLFRTEDVILRPWIPCRPSQGVGIGDRLIRRRSTESEMDNGSLQHGVGGGRFGRDRVSGMTTTLWPYSSITAGVSVLNGARTGEISETITFNTPEGVPGPVKQLAVIERGSHHIKLSWQQPNEINGVLTGYVIRYKEVSQQSKVWESAVVGLLQNKKIRELKDSTSYMITVYATTRVGQGVETTVQATTSKSLLPDAPIIDKIDVGYDYLLVTWQPSDRSTDSNPASEFVVEYRMEGSSDWMSVDPEHDHSSVNITDLVHGVQYELRVVGRNPVHPSGVASRTERIVVGYQPPAESNHPAVASSSWFITLVCLLSLLLLLLLIGLLFRYNRGGKYPVFEKERQHGTNGGHIAEEDRFCEFVRSEDPAKRKSQGSLESSSRSEEDEDGSDSLGVYEDGDPAKFNEDGSFVDQSGYKKLIDGAHTNPIMIVTSSPQITAHTFV